MIASKDGMGYTSLLFDQGCLWHKHTGFDNEQSIKSFLYITTRNACLNFLRHVKVKDTVHRELVYLEEGRGQELMLNQLIRLEMMQEIYNEIEKMPEKRREVFKLAYLEGMKILPTKWVYPSLQ